MNLDRNISSTRIVWAVGLLLGLGLAIYIGSAVGSQDLEPVVLIIGASAAIATFLFLGKDYWMLIPLSLGASFPAVPLGARTIEFPELAIAGCAVFFVIRVATRKEKVKIFQSVNIPIILFMAWVAMVYVLNPIGLAMLGSQTGGGRFYLKLALAFASYLIMCSRTYTERDIKWVIGFLIFGAFFSLVYGLAEYILVGPKADPVSGLVTEEFYSWHQLLAGPALIIVYLMFSRWTPRQVFGIQRPARLVLFAFCLVMVLFSGKRMAIVSLILAPLIAAGISRQYIYIFLGMFITAAGLGVIVAGHGQWFQLPLLAQRTVSWLPGDWDPELAQMRGGSDEWRAELRNFAYENIKRDPIVGRGFAVDISETITAVGMESYASGIDIQTAAYALGRSWHNRWLGYAADFGIPLSVIQAVLYITMLVAAYRSFRRYGYNNLLGVISLYVLIFTCKDIIGSYTSGHTSDDAFERWWLYGLTAAIYTQSLAARGSRFRAQRAPRMEPRQAQ